MRNLAPFLLLLLAGQAAAQAAPPAAHDTVRGLVRAVDLRAGYVEVTAGVGLALRIVRTRIVAETRATEAGATLPLREIKAGDVVRIEYGTRANMPVAYHIQRLGRLDAVRPEGP